jgi:hypothetical protein
MFSLTGDSLPRSSYLTMILRRGGEAADFIEVVEEKTQ